MIVLRLRRASKPRVSSWVVLCSECGQLDADDDSQRGTWTKPFAERVARFHARNSHPGVDVQVRIPR